MVIKPTGQFSFKAKRIPKGMRKIKRSDVAVDKNTGMVWIRVRDNYVRADKSSVLRRII